ncbi:MAG: hypothetical protein HY287_10475 [Planctomycetes bacterium]|nr:hypothetical protein [Planctomycetota bacterium]
MVYLYDGQKIIQANDGSGNMVQQFIHGTQYIDELVMVRVANKGDLYLHQDANWNVIGMTDLGHHLVEHYKYSPYGELTVDQDTGYGDRDGDGIVNSTDKGTVGVTCTGTVSGACRILDLDFDGDYDSTDAGNFNYLAQGSQKRPGKQSTGVSQPFAHQGLLFEPEIASYQNRARQYDPTKRRFAQRDPLLLARAARFDYVDGMSAYSYVRSNPGLLRDATGNACTVHFQCCPSGPGTLQGCTRTCPQRCTETSRILSDGGEITCDDVPPNVTKPDQADVSSACCRLSSTLFPVPPCPTACYNTEAIYWNLTGLPSRNCSKAACSTGCGLAADICHEGCSHLVFWEKQLCDVECNGVVLTCTEVCNAWCELP